MKVAVRSARPPLPSPLPSGDTKVESSWNVMAHGDARERKWRGNWGMEWVANSLHTTSEHGVSSITTAEAHNSTASGRLNWSSCRFKWTSPFRRKWNQVSARVPSHFKRNLPPKSSGWRLERVALYRGFPMLKQGISAERLLWSLSADGTISGLTLHYTLLLRYSNVFLTCFDRLCLLFWSTLKLQGFFFLNPLCLTLRRLMSYIYGGPILDVSRSHTTTQQSR